MARTLGWYGLPALTGALWWAAFPPLGLWPLAWAAPAPLALFALGEPRRGRRFWAAYGAGTATMAAAFFWTRHVFPAGPFALAAYFGLYLPLFGALVRMLVLELGMPATTAVPAAWISCDFLRGTLFTGLPYYLIGHSQVGWPVLAQVADLGGEHLVGLAPLLAGGWLTDAFRSGARAAAPKGLAVAAAAAAVIVYGLARPANFSCSDGPRVALVQPNIPQDNKELAKLHADPALARRHRDAIHARMIAMTRALLERTAADPPDLVVWPETAWLGPVCVDPKNRAEIWTDDPIKRLDVRAPPPLLFGCERFDAPAGIRRLEGYDAHVSGVLVGGDGRLIGWYDKVHLVPFGEYLPLSGVALVRMAYEKLSRMSGVPDLAAGPGPSILQVRGSRFGQAICFEAIFSDAVRSSVDAGASFVVNLSNEAWFRDSVELPLMLQICRLRAIENRRAVVRATNSGLSGFILPTGELEADLAPHREGTLVHRVRTMDETTVYRRIGEAFPEGCLAFVGLAAGIAAYRRLRAARN
jgi:apolipoprotein N-acyltransferase